MGASIEPVADEPAGWSAERGHRAAERTWDQRTDAWLDAALGDRLPDVTGVLPS